MGDEDVRAVPAASHDHRTMVAVGHAVRPKAARPFDRQHLRPQCPPASEIRAPEQLGAGMCPAS